MDFFNELFLKKIFAAFAILLLFATMGCVKTGEPDIVAKAIPIAKFSSCADLSKAFKDSKPNYGLMEYAVMGISAPLMATTRLGSVAKSSADVSAPTSSTRYSETNVQVQGVDEADIVKTDGKYIYLISKNQLIIAEAFPSDNAKILSKTDLNGISPKEIFIEKNFILLFGTKSYQQPYYAEGVQKKSIDIMPPYRSFSATVVQLIDVSDRENPKIARTVDFEGNYLSSRKIGETAYFAINSYPRYEALDEMAKTVVPFYDIAVSQKIVPNYRDSSKTQTFEPIARCGKIGYLEPIQAQSFVTIASISMANPDSEIKKETVVGSAQNVYSSMENFYIAQTNYNYGKIRPMNSQKMPIIGDIVQPENTEETIVHKFSLSNGNIAYLGKMTAPGTILNQFSMDEFDNHFRIATTKGHVSRGGTNSTNNIYVFDSELKQVGKLEDLAPGEKIYSARFMGKKAYLVTFKKVDPLFVIDLSNPSDPKVLGKLKIPGYSDYLHPIDETHLIGLGKDTVEGDEQGSFAWYQGIKIAIFDVSDVENPKELFKTVVGDRGTDSPALQDHKAFLYDKEKNLLVLPITLAEIKNKTEEMSGYTYGDFVWQGAYVWNLTLEKGFELKGKITHDENNENAKKAGYYYYGGNTEVKRTLFIEDLLYTISDAKIKLNSLNDLSEIKELKIRENNENNYYGMAE